MLLHVWYKMHKDMKGLQFCRIRNSVQISFVVKNIRKTKGRDWERAANAKQKINENDRQSLREKEKDRESN